MRKIIIVLAILFFTVYANAKDLYVDMNDGSCSDSTNYATNDADNPWCTLGRATWGNASKASETSGEAAQAGDTVHILVGTYNTTTYTDDRTEPVYDPVNSGTSENRIVFQAVGTVVLTSTATTGNGEPLLGTSATDYITFDGFTVSQADMNYRQGNGVVAVWGEYTTISNCTITGEYTEFGSPDNHCGIWISGGEGSETVGTIIENCIITGFTGNSSRNDSAITMYYVGQTTIRHNEISLNSTGIYVKGGSSSGPVDIYLNLIHNNTVDGIALHGAAGDGDVYQNVIRDNRNGIDFFGISSGFPNDMQIVNNTLYDNDRNVYLNADCTQITSNLFKNNIIAEGDYAINGGECAVTEVGSDEVDFDYNVFYSPTTFGAVNGGDINWTTWTTTYSQDANSTEGTDPLFTGVGGDDYTLQAGSICREGNAAEGVDILDLDGDSSTVDAITVGAYITGDESIGLAFESAIPTGTVTANVTESSIVTGGEELVITLSNDTWVATVGDDNGITTALIAGIDSDKGEGTGWDAEVKGNMVHGDVVRTNDTVVTITLAAEAAYDITESETITVTIPTTAVTSETEIVATPTFTVNYEAAASESVSVGYVAGAPSVEYNLTGISVE